MYYYYVLCVAYLRTVTYLPTYLPTFVFTTAYILPIFRLPLQTYRLPTYLPTVTFRPTPYLLLPTVLPNHTPHTPPPTPTTTHPTYPHPYPYLPWYLSTKDSCTLDIMYVLCDGTKWSISPS